MPFCWTMWSQLPGVPSAFSFWYSNCLAVWMRWAIDRTVSVLNQSTDDIKGIRNQNCGNDTHTHTFNSPFPGPPGWAGTRKVKPIWILLKQETVSGSGICRAICKSAPSSRQKPCKHPTTQSFLQAGCTSCLQTNRVKALKATNDQLIH